MNGRARSGNLPGRDVALQLKVLVDAPAVALAAARDIAREARLAVQERGRFILALSGGSTPWQMLRFLATQELPWERLHLVQVDERLAPEGHLDRNFTHIRENLLRRVPLPPGQVHAMPVEAPDPDAAAAWYARTLADIAGLPPVLDLVHLGLGADGHTASLLPDDPVLQVIDRDVAVTAVYQGRRRLTLTYPIINRARCLYWLVTGAAKAPMLRRLIQGDRSIPAGRIRRDGVMVLADQAAAASLEPA